MDANVNGVLYLVQAVLPAMRQQGAGTIVNVGSEAGKQASRKSGAAYVVSKFGMTGLTQTINCRGTAQRHSRLLHFSLATSTRPC
jgi:NAD(P)-dependent dehydrogenase (short-subunit alcohol dehydrogenase family)